MTTNSSDWQPANMGAGGCRNAHAVKSIQRPCRAFRTSTRIPDCRHSHEREDGPLLTHYGRWRRAACECCWRYGVHLMGR